MREAEGIAQFEGLARRGHRKETGDEYMKLNSLTCVAIVASLSGTALAGSGSTTVSTEGTFGVNGGLLDLRFNVNQTSNFVQNFGATYGSGASDPSARLNRHFSIGSLDRALATGRNDASNELANFTFDTRNASDGTNAGFNLRIDNNTPILNPGPGTFYFGDTDTLGTQDFDGGDDLAPSLNQLAVGFGNRQWTSNELRFKLTPGVTAFGFNYEDIGDVGGTLEIKFRDLTGSSIFTHTVNIDATASADNAMRDGFISLVAADGFEIDTILFSQGTPGSQAGDPNDGFIFYGFSTVTFVPIPPAAFAGLGLLGAMAGVRKFRNR